MIDLSEEMIVIHMARLFKTLSDVKDSDARLSLVQDGPRSIHDLFVNDSALFERLERRAVRYELLRRSIVGAT